ncbi:protein kinase family protein [Rubripirellula lacrimiformis]|uniref:hypothetical protein n=1 Tax=Rubripirellula lacrimiformis TaxID=1930273 RepID=UPI0011A37E4B|nr:hypothetical protein [Rubripirellula lacrimiformis]
MTKSTAQTDLTVDGVDHSVMDETMLAEPAKPPSDIDPAGKAKPSKAGSWRMGLVLGSGPSMSEESHRRLQERLRLASLLMGSGFATYFILKLLGIFHSTAEPRPIVFWTHLAVTIAELAIGWRLCVNCKMALRGIRIVEAIVFGGPAIFFVMINFQNLKDSLAAGYMADISPPWLLLLFTYALFIPNTWQRAAAVIVPLAMIPLGITVGARLTSGTFAQVMSDDPDLRFMLIRLFLTMIWAATIAIWGVRSIRSLRREAFEARKMGQYQLKKLLGKGGMGEVYLAEHRMLKRPCAIKLIRPEMAQSAQNLARFEREVQATARLTH